MLEKHYCEKSPKLVSVNRIFVDVFSNLPNFTKFLQIQKEVCASAQDSFSYMYTNSACMCNYV